MGGGWRGSFPPKQMQIKKRQVTEFIFDSFVLSSYQVTLGDLEIFNLSCKEHQKPSDEHSNFPGGDMP